MSQTTTNVREPSAGSDGGTRLRPDESRSTTTTGDKIVGTASHTVLVIW